MKPRHLYYRSLLWWFAPFRIVDRTNRWRNIARRARQQAAAERAKAENALGRLRMTQSDLANLRERQMRSIEMVIENPARDGYDRYALVLYCDYDNLFRSSDLKPLAEEMIRRLIGELEQIKRDRRNRG